jgi:hypothetical protein
MAPKKEKKVDVEWAGPFLKARFAFQDEAGGHIEVVPGLETRIRVASIDQYHLLEPGVLCLHMRDSGGNETHTVQVIGTLETMDDIMRRNQLKEVGS